MKKLFLTFILVVIILLSFTNQAKALCTDPAAKDGLVPCGQTVNKKGELVCPCEIGHFFVMLARIYNFIVYMIATPLAIIALTIGGIVLMISAGNPNMARASMQKRSKGSA